MSSGGKRVVYTFKPIMARRSRHTTLEGIFGFKQVRRTRKSIPARIGRGFGEPFYGCGSLMRFNQPLRIPAVFNGWR